MLWRVRIRREQFAVAERSVAAAAAVVISKKQEFSHIIFIIDEPNGPFGKL